MHSNGIREAGQRVLKVLINSVWHMIPALMQQTWCHTIISNKMEIIIISWIAAIILCWAIAKGNGRAEGKAVVMGILFGWIAVITYACIGKSFEKKLAEVEALRKANN